LKVSAREVRGSARLSCVDVAAIAALTAAALSLVGVVVNVVWSYRLSSRGQLEQWRRNEERPIVARLLTLSDEAVDKWTNGHLARRAWISSLADPSQASEDTKAKDVLLEQWDAGSELYEKLVFEAAQLDLIAGRPLREAAKAFSQEHMWMMAIGALSDRSDWFEWFAAQVGRIGGSRNDLVVQARADLGIDSGSESRLRSPWRRFQARRKLARVRAAYPAFMIQRNAGAYRFVAIERATGKRVALADTIERMEALVADRQLAREGEESPGLDQDL
jgi:hypothetical protein